MGLFFLTEVHVSQGTQPRWVQPGLAGLHSRDPVLLINNQTVNLFEVYSLVVPKEELKKKKFGNRSNQVEC